MLTSLLPVIARQAAALLGDQATVTVVGHMSIRVVDVSFDEGFLECTLEEWMDLVTQELESRD